MSEEFLYWSAKQRDGIRGEGTTFVAGVSGLYDNGQCLAQHWPYDETCSHLDPTYGPTAEASADALTRRGNGTAVRLTVDQARGHLAGGSPVAIAIPMWDGFETADMDSVTPTPIDLGSRQLEHAVVVAGHDPTTGAVLLRNSWGPTWGTHGYAWISDALVTESSSAAAWVVIELPDTP